MDRRRNLRDFMNLGMNDKPVLSLKAAIAKNFILSLFKSV